MNAGILAAQEANKQRMSRSELKEALKDVDSFLETHDITLPPVDLWRDVPPEVTKARQNAFLAAYRITRVQSRACEAAEVPRRIMYDWTVNDTLGFKERFNQVRLEVAGDIEAAAIERAIEGCKRYKFDKEGNPLKHPVTGDPYFELDFPEALTIFLLKGQMPDVYMDRRDVTTKGHAIGGPIGAMGIEELSDDQIDELLKNAEAGKATQALPSPSSPVCETGAGGELVVEPD